MKLTEADEIAFRKSVRLDDYAEILAHVVHFGTEGDVVERFGLLLDQWRAVDRAWTNELARGAELPQREHALGFSATFQARRQRLAEEKPALAAIGQDPMILRDKRASAAPQTAAKPSGVPSFMLAEFAPKTAEGSPWSAYATPSPIIAPAPAPAAPPPLPFAQGVAAEVALQRAVEHAQATQGAPSATTTLGATRAIDNEISAIARQVVPFAAAETRPDTASTPDPELTLEQHASLHVELDMYPEAAEEILGRYGLTESQHGRLDVGWEAQMALNPKLVAVWEQAMADYRAWLASTRSH
jgi:hypothetical protein